MFNALQFASPLIASSGGGKDVSQPFLSSCVKRENPTMSFPWLIGGAPDASCEFANSAISRLQQIEKQDILQSGSSRVPAALRPFVPGSQGDNVQDDVLDTTVSPRLASRSGAAVGDTRNVSILFADVVGSTKLLRGMDAEDARDLLDQAIELVKEAVHAFGGSVARIQGDGVMAMFGVMAVIEDHALRAALAACRIRDRVTLLQSGQGGEIRIRIGVHSGPILLRWLDSDFGRVLDAVGQAAHIAGKVEQNAPPNSVAISGETLAMIDEPVTSSLLMTLSLAEEGKPLEVHQLESVDAALSGSVSIKGQTIHPLIGREDAIGRIRALFRDLEDGKAGSLALVGEAGLGKSRLLFEAGQIADQAGVDYAIIRGRELSRNQPFGALLPVLRHLFESREKGFSTALTKALSKDEAESLTGLFAQPSEQVVLQMLPDERKRLIVSASYKAIVETSRLHAFALLVDDLQYLDRETLNLIELIEVRKEAAQLVLLFGARPEGKGFIDDLGISALTLRPLAENDARGLISTILGDQPEMEALVDEIALRAAGLPLAIEEFSAFVASQPDGNDTQGLRLPPRLENVFRARIDQLDTVAGELCALCCAMGPAVPLPVLRLVAPLAGDEFEQAFQSLVDARILRADLSGHVQFSHQLFQEAGYKGIPRKRREALHASLYEALSASNGEEAVAPLELARHAELGGNDGLALNHLWKACEEAVGFAALETVRTILHQARTLASRLGPEGKAYAARFSLLAFDALQQLGYQGEARDCFVAIVDGTHNFPKETQVLAQSHLAMLEWIEGNLDRAIVHGRAALRDSTTIRSLPITCYAEFCQAHVEFATGETQTAVNRLQSIDARLSARDETTRFGAMISIPAIMARSFASWYASDIGAFDLAEANARSVITLSEKLQHNYSRVLGRMSSGYALLRRGEIDEASALLGEATRDCIEHNFGGLEPMTSAWYALALLEQGKILQANRVLNESERLGHNRRILNSCHYYGLEAQARLLALSGEGEAALLRAEAARSHAASQGDRVHAVSGTALMAELEVRLNGTSETLKLRIDEIRLDAEALGLTPLAERLAKMALS